MSANLRFAGCPRSGIWSAGQNLWKQFRRRYYRPWRQVTYAGIRVHYKKHLDGGGTGFGQGFVPLLQGRGMPKQQRIFEWCAGPGFIGFSLYGHGLCETLCLADINGSAVDACHRTISDNGLAEHVSVYKSDNLKAIPASERWDLVVGNPPHFADDYSGSLRDHDEDWRLHRSFFHTVGPFLKEGGVIVLQENSRGSTVDSFRTMIEESGLSIVFVVGGTPERTPFDRFYYIGLMRRADTLPQWARTIPPTISVPSRA